MLLEVDGKLIVKKSDPSPLRCPSCHRFFPPERGTGVSRNEPIRCPFCAQQAEYKTFVVDFVTLTDAKVLTYF